MTQQTIFFKNICLYKRDPSLENENVHIFNYIMFSVIVTVLCRNALIYGIKISQDSLYKFKLPIIKFLSKSEMVEQKSRVDLR